jgi:hypothetical protein
MTHVAFADCASVIRFGRRCPKGALPIGRYRRLPPCMTLLSVVARLAHDNEILLVRGVPDDAALAAVVAFVKAVETRLKERAL